MEKLIKIQLILFLFISKSIIFAQSTPNGTNLSSYVNNNVPALTQGQIDWINNEVATVYPNIVEIDGPTHTYNCHGYAWIKHDGGGDYWLNDPGDDQFWLDNSYIQTVKKLKRGVKIVNFTYPKLDGDEKGLVERKSDRIILVD